MKKELRTDFLQRQYMVSKDFEIYYYSDRHLQKVADHTHSYYEFYFFLNGEVSIEINRQSHVLSRGDMVFIPPGIEHHVDILDPSGTYERFVFWISKEYFDHLSRSAREYRYLVQLSEDSHTYIYPLDVFRFNAICSRIITLIEEQRSNRFGRETRLSICVQDLLFYLNRTIYEQMNLPSSMEEEGLYGNLLSYIEDHLEDELSLDMLSAHFFVSKYHIAHIFKAQMGISIHQYIVKKRLALCCNAILNHTDIGEACLMSGFQDYSSFYRAFKKEYGMSPKEYRQLQPDSSCRSGNP